LNSWAEDMQEPKNHLKKNRNKKIKMIKVKRKSNNQSQNLSLKSRKNKNSKMMIKCLNKKTISTILLIKKDTKWV
jgi:hypothetical protein